jgi:membrane-associated phospholipid phosphatase
MSTRTTARQRNAGTGSTGLDVLSTGLYWTLMAAGLARTFLSDRKKDKVCALRLADVLVASTVLARGAKMVIPEKRPDSGSHDSFPSSHTLNVAALATISGAYCKQQRPFWLESAALVGVSRIVARRHYVRDVVGGALLGYGLARWELSRRRGFVAGQLARIGARGATTPTAHEDTRESPKREGATV